MVIAGIQPSCVDNAIGAPNCHLLCQNATTCAIMTLIQRNRFLNRFWRANRFDSTDFVFNEISHSYTGLLAGGDRGNCASMINLISRNHDYLI
jgi:hypothetical protein